MKYLAQCAAIAVIATSVTSPVFAAGATKPALLSTTDRGLLSDVLATNQLEIDVSAYAATQSQSARIREFAKDMAAEHRKLAPEINKANDGIVLPPQPTPQPGINLQDRTGTVFDKAYVTMMVTYDKSIMSRLGTASNGPPYGPAIAEMAKTTLPTVRGLAAKSKAMERTLPAN